jgi:periplasmic protein TonB
LLFKLRSSNLAAALDLKSISPLTLSSAGHGLLVALILLVLVYEPSIKIVEFEVVQTPIQAPRPLTIAKPKPKPRLKAAKEKAVFGASRKAILSLQTDSETMDVKKGNTVAKTPDDKILNDDDPDSLPIPTEEYLVSSMPRLLSEFRIPYPKKAKENNIEGPVVMDILIDQKGIVREISLVTGPGYGLDQAALDAVKRFSFKAAEVEGKPVAVRIRYTYRFVLEK